MEQYPKRVLQQNQSFTMLPPYIHTGAEFALIPSRDEPFWLGSCGIREEGSLGLVILPFHSILSF